MIGDTIGGRYEIVRPLGEGGMGAVYEARQISTGRRVALKMIHPAKLRTPQLVARFEIEARAAGGIESEHVVQVLDVDYDETKKIPFLAMELLNGEGLDVLLNRYGKLPVELVLRIGVQVCRGLERAHACGILHRDIKPANLILTERDGEELRVKIVDFGLAKVFADDARDPSAPKLTATGMILGSPLYMSPEQARASRDLDARTDVWSLGMVLYELLTGRSAFEGLAPLTKVIEAITTRPVPPIRTFEPSIDIGVASTVERALDLSPDRRFANISELREALERHLRGEPRIERKMLEALPPKAQSSARTVASNEQVTVIERAGAATPAAPLAGAAMAGPTKPSGGPMTAPPVSPGTERHANVVIPIELPTEPLHAQRFSASPAGTLISGEKPGPATAKTGDASPLTERISPRTEVFLDTPRIPAPPAPEARRARSRIVPGIAAVALAASLATGAYYGLRSGGDNTDDPVISMDPSGKTRVPSTKPSAAARTAPPSASAPLPFPAPASPLLGIWRSESGRVLEGVAVGDGIELRIKDRKGFEEQGYALGETKFSLRPSASSSDTFDVTDHARPLPPAGAAYDPGALASCVMAFSQVASRRLTATLRGDVLTIEQAILTTGPAAFQMQGNTVLGCKLERVMPALATSKLLRQR
jgi:serine/threonine protein kinase